MALQVQTSNREKAADISHTLFATTERSKQQLI